MMDVYKEITLTVANSIKYKHKSHVQKGDVMENKNSIVTELLTTMEGEGLRIRFGNNTIRLDE